MSEDATDGLLAVAYCPSCGREIGRQCYGEATREAVIDAKKELSVLRHMDFAECLTDQEARVVLTLRAPVSEDLASVFAPKHPDRECALASDLPVLPPAVAKKAIEDFDRFMLMVEEKQKKELGYGDPAK